MTLWKFNRTDVIITLKNGAVVRGFVEDYCDASDNDEEIDSLLVDVDGTLYEYFEDEIVSIIESQQWEQNLRKKILFVEIVLVGMVLYEKG